VRWPTTSRPSRIHERRTSSSRSPVDSATAVARPELRFAGSRTRRSESARRARAASRWSRSAMRVGRSVRGRRAGRSTRRRSTERPVRRAAAIARPSSRVGGVTTTSHSSRIPRLTASTGSKLRARSSQATTPPAAWASAATRRASVVRPLEPLPRMATLALLGSPPGPRIASSSAKPVGMIRSVGWPTGTGDGLGTRSGTRAGARARAPWVASAGWSAARSASARAASPSRRGAAAPHRAWRLVRAAVTSVRWLVTPRV
jgi:hypothetical protein